MHWILLSGLRYRFALNGLLQVVQALIGVIRTLIYIVRALVIDAGGSGDIYGLERALHVV